MNHHIPHKLCLWAGLLTTAFTCCVQAEWKPVAGNIMTPWAEKVSPKDPLPEYPRPQMVRKNWVNLNGLWDYAITDKDAARPAKFEEQILVPFCVESALSGVKKELTDQQRLWYHRTFESPSLAGGKRLLLHFGAVDWDAEVSINGKSVGTHRGGYGSFVFDITDQVKAKGPNELVVSVADPSDNGPQAAGKQRLASFGHPGGIYYTPCSGIWQTVWLEAVPSNYIHSLKVEPDVDAGTVRVTVKGGKGAVSIAVEDGGKVVAEGKGSADQPVTLKIPDAKLWSPDSPFLYDLKVKLGKDSVAGYFGMRKIAIGKDHDGFARMMLNNKFVFESGPLDQGYWPDGIYTAPTDEALKYDLEMTKKFGFNMTRKHAKVEPARWYYWCDKLGLLVWQDMPSGRSGHGNGVKDRALKQTAVSLEAAQQFEAELREMIGELENHPSIIVWTVFNEGWGQYDTPRLVEIVRGLDASRLINDASGWTDFKVGDIIDMHRYPGPGMFPAEEKRAAVNGEFGGLGLRVADHLWASNRPFSYRNMKDGEMMGAEYQRLWAKVGQLEKKNGLNAAVYTQLTDVECELNGLMTYDRKVTKIDPCKFSAASFAHGEFPPIPVFVDVLSTSQENAVEWRYVTSQPGDGWFKPGFDDSAWSKGEGGFGTINNEVAKSRTPWTSSDIWLRKEFDLSKQQLPLNHPFFSMFHDEDAEVYLNGVLAHKITRYNTKYDEFLVSNEAAAALKPGKNVIAVHCKQTAGGQYIDVGIRAEKEPSSNSAQ